MLRPKDRFDNHYVRGAHFHASAFTGLHHGQSVEMELVPEPGNPHDRWAVALHVNHARIGYIAAEMAGEWQDFVVTCNRRGSEVFARGVFDRERAEVAATVFLPWEKELAQIALEEDIIRQCDQLLVALPADKRREIISVGGWGLNSEHANSLHVVRELAPDLNWKPNSKGHMWDSLPSQIVWRLAALSASEKKILMSINDR